ncbi:MAG: RNA polymerase sigma factor SigZ [Planctomycetota bacterium]
MASAPLSTERLWELLSDRLRTFFARRIDDQQVADDLLQETFVRIHKGLDGLGDEQHIEPWVFQIARHLVIDHHRATKATTGHEGGADAAAARDPATADNLSEVVGRWLPAMIAQLQDPYAEAVRLYELEGLPQQEIADRLGISLSGAKSRIQRGREKLKAVLFSCCSFEHDRRGNVIGFKRRGADQCGPCADP